MTWKDRLQPASFRGVPFKTEDESLIAGRRVETHEFVNRDKPYTEDLGKITLRPKITAYVIGDDCYEQRDRLIEALNKPGPGTLVHPAYGEMSVCVDALIFVSLRQVNLLIRHLGPRRPTRLFPPVLPLMTVLAITLRSSVWTACLISLITV